MKLRSLVVAAMCLFGMTTFAQDVTEPEFIGEVLYVAEGQTPAKLEKARATVKTKLGASVYLTGIGKAKGWMYVEGASSPVKVNSASPRFVVRAVDNNSDPMAVVSLFKFTATKKDRKAEVSSVSTLGGSSSNNMDYVPFDAKKYGESSYLLVPSVKMESGEYGITVSNPNNKDEKSVIVSCFSYVAP